MDYREIDIRIKDNDEPIVEGKVRRACMFLETMINSEVFKDFVINDIYFVPEKGGKEATYHAYLSRKIKLSFIINSTMTSMTGEPFILDEETNNIIVNPDLVFGWSVPKIAAYIAHAYCYILEFKNNEMFECSFAFVLKFEGKVFFEKFYKKLRNKIFPRKYEWLYYTGDWWNLWLWKRIKFKSIYDI